MSNRYAYIGIIMRESKKKRHKRKRALHCCFSSNLKCLVAVESIDTFCLLQLLYLGITNYDDRISALHKKPIGIK